MAFYIRRFFRIIPVLALALILTAVLAQLFPDRPDFFGTSHETITYTTAILGMFFNYAIIGLPNWSIHSIHSYLGLWSISTEEQYYLLFPLLMLLPTNKARLLLILGFYIIWAIMLRLGVFLAPSIFSSPRWLALMQSPLFRYDLIALGMLILLLPIKAKASLGITLAGLVIAGIYETVGPNIYRDTVGHWIFSLALVLVVSSAANDKDIIFANSFIGRWLHWLGERSYAIYVLHFQILAILGYTLQKYSINFSSPEIYSLALFLGFFPFLYLIDLVHRYYEKPCINIGHRLALRVTSGAKYETIRVGRL